MIAYRPFSISLKVGFFKCIYHIKTILKISVRYHSNFGFYSCFSSRSNNL